MHPPTRFLAALCLAVFGGAGRAADDPKALALAAQAQAVLAQACLKCHANADSQYFDVRDRAALVAARKGKKKFYVVPGKPEESFLWEMMADNDALMPQGGSDERARITQAQRDIVRDWIAVGAPDFPKEPERKFVPLDATLTAIRDHALKAGNDAANFRYFTLTNLHNDNKHVTAADLRMARAALSKAVNSLSWKQSIEVPQVVDGTDGTVLAVNIQKLGWTREMWNAVAAAYPYHLGFDNHDNDKLKPLDDTLRKLVGTDIPVVVRADWFVATATRPPLYHKLLYDLYLPELVKRKADPSRPDNPKRMTATDLEEFLGVKVIENLLKKTPEVMRAGFPSSGVSGQNRLIERHPLGQGAYWKSYDFKTSTWEANLIQFPLGPVSAFQNTDFSKQAFKHDGGEIIFHLLNGLQGYLLVDGDDRRIDAGPIEVVHDAANTSGTPVVVNGVSCMACHKDGMRSSPADAVRGGKGVTGTARDRVKELYPEPAVLNTKIDADRDLFLKNLETAVGPFLRFDAATKAKKTAEFAEPVSEVARRYYAAKDDLDAATVACELHLPDPKLVVAKAGASDVWRQLGLGALATEGGRIKRGAWESVRGTSQMQQAAREFGYSPR